MKKKCRVQGNGFHYRLMHVNPDGVLIDKKTLAVQIRWVCTREVPVQTYDASWPFMGGAMYPEQIHALSMYPEVSRSYD